ncbi:MAG: cytochrome c-type biogenesis protein CcmH [Alcanivoracaceae bacterium]|nr:cytochrome c-type biogenesis protein CcmH [Alcanivoracaceae bacterium]
MKKLIWLLVLLPAMASAVIDVYQFEQPEQERRFRGLIEQLRCPKCQNQSISDSDADIAQDMRAQVSTMIRDGRSDEEIVQYFTDRYGDFVNYKPPVNAQTMILWAGPGVVFFIGLVLVIVQIRRARGLVQEKDSEA